MIVQLQSIEPFIFFFSKYSYDPGLYFIYLWLLEID